MVWYGTVRYGTVRYGIWYGMVWYGMVWYGTPAVWYGMAWYGMVWYGTPALIQWQSMRHLVAEGSCSGKIHATTNKRTENWFRCRRIWHNDGLAGWSVFPNRYLLSRAAVGRQMKQVVWSCFHCICSRLFRIPGMPFWRPRFFVQRFLQ